MQLFLTFSVIGQNSKNHTGFFSKVSKQNDLSIPGISDTFLKFHSQNKSTKHLPLLKEANGLKQRLDSVVAPGYDKDEYVYNTNGNVLLDTYFNWDGSQWVNSWKDEYAYDSNGNQTQNISYEWDGSQWINSGKNENSYDSNSNQVKKQYSNWDGSNWLNSHKNEFVYDSENNLTQNISSQWSGSPDDIWIESSKNDFVYDLNGNQTQNISYSWDGNHWVNSSKTEFVFDANGKNTQTFVFGWDGENWVNSAKYETVYDTKEKISQYILSEWDGIDWLEAAKYEYEYDANGNMTLSNLIYFDGDVSITFLKEESVYDDFDNRTIYSVSVLDFETFQLLPEWKEVYVYDNNFSFEDLILPFTSSDFESDFEEGPGQDLNLMFKHKLTNITDYEGDGNSWMMTGDYAVYYSEQNVTGVNELNLAGNVNVYPNPAINQITFNINAAVNQFTVEFYDIQGKLVLSKISENNRPVSVESLNEGLYFYRLSDKLNFYTGKFMVK